MLRRHYLTAVFVLLLSRVPVGAQTTKNPESFWMELTGSAWLNGPTGTIQADGTPINFVSDLAAGARQPRFYGRLVLKPGRKHRFVIEGAPLAFAGINTLDRSFVFLHKTYNVHQTIATNASINYAFAGYQYDFVSGRYGHFGLQTGAAWLGVNGTLSSAQADLSETKSFQAPLPLMGAEFRLFPIPRHRLVQLEGMMRGIPAARYGYFVEGGAYAGLHLGQFAVLAGYRELFADIHDSAANGDGVALRLKGPLFALQWEWPRGR